jgi:hypothetical protein
MFLLPQSCGNALSASCNNLRLENISGMLQQRNSMMLSSVSNGSGFGLELNWNHWNGLYHPKTRTIAIGPVLSPKTRHFNISTLTPIKYLSSDRTVTWLVCRWCSSSRSFTSGSPMCDPTNMYSVAIENPQISPKLALMSQPRKEYQLDHKSETMRWKRGENCTIYILIMSWYNQNSNT